MANENTGVTNPGGASGAGENNTTSNTTHASGGGQQPVGGGTGENTNPNEKVYTFKEDRSDWIPRTRFNEVAQRNKQLAEQAQKAAEYEEEIKRLRALAAGINLPSKEEAEKEALKRELASLIDPEEIFGMTKEELQALKQDRAAIRATVQAQWERHAQTMLKQVADKVTEAYGIKDLTERQRNRLLALYRDEVSAAYNARERARETGEFYDASNDALARHERGDVGFITEFVESFIEDFVKPAERKITADMQRKYRPVPSGRDRSITTTKLPEVDLSDPENFKKAIAEARAQRGTA